MKEKNFRLSVILLAAGDSRRFNGNKMLAEVEGEPMYLHMLKNILDISASKKVLVTQYREIIDFLSDSVYGNTISVVRNDYSERGISYSIRLGIMSCKEAPEEEHEKEAPREAYLFAVCDQPWLTRESIGKLIAAFADSEKRIACLSYQGSLGNPVIFDGYYRDELLSLSGDTGGKAVIRRHLDDVELVEVNDSRELSDIDTKQEYESGKAGK